MRKKKNRGVIMRNSRSRFHAFTRILESLMELMIFYDSPPLEAGQHLSLAWLNRLDGEWFNVMTFVICSAKAATFKYLSRLIRYLCT